MHSFVSRCLKVTLRTLQFLVILPCQIPSPLQHVHALCRAPALLPLLAIYTCNGGSEPD
jgi:hypothetical protein